MKNLKVQQEGHADKRFSGISLFKVRRERMPGLVFGIGLLLFLFTNLSGAYAQESNFLRRYVSRLINDTTDISRPQFLIYPTIAYAPETSWEYGLSSLYVFYANRDTSNRLSEINGFTFFTLAQQYGLWFDHAAYSHQDLWFFLGRLRYQSFPLLFFGIGPESPSAYQARVDGNQLQLREKILRKVGNNLFLGVQVDYQRLSRVNFVQGSGPALEIPPGSEGSQNLGLGLSLVYDTRHNVLNVRDGYFSDLSFTRADQAWGSDYNFTSLTSDTRIFRPLGKRDVLALQLYGEFNIGQVPFNQMALMGGESLMRGYYLGRYRDNNQVASQLEYRFLPLPLGFTNRLGAAVFAGSGTVFQDFNKLSADDFVFSGGAGLRFLLFPKRDIYTRLDIAFTREGSGFYLFVGEAF